MKLIGIAGLLTLTGVILLFVGLDKGNPLNIFTGAAFLCLSLGAILTFIYKWRMRGAAQEGR